MHRSTCPHVRRQSFPSRCIPVLPLIIQHEVRTALFRITHRPRPFCQTSETPQLSRVARFTLTTCVRHFLLLRHVSHRPEPATPRRSHRRHAACNSPSRAPLGAPTRYRRCTKSRHRSHTAGRMHAKDEEWRQAVDELQGHAAERWQPV